MRSGDYEYIKKRLNCLIRNQEVNQKYCENNIEDYIPCEYYEKGWKLHISGCLCWVNKEASTHGLFQAERIRLLDVSCMETSGVTNMSHMFKSCGNLEQVNGIGSLNTSNVTDMSYMFSSCGLSYMEKLNFDTRKVKSMMNMFSYALSKESNQNNIITIDLSSCDLSNVENMRRMFYNNMGYNIVIDFGKSKIKQNINTESMFEDCDIVYLLSSDTKFLINKARYTYLSDEYKTMFIINKENKMQGIVMY